MLCKIKDPYCYLATQSNHVSDPQWGKYWQQLGATDSPGNLIVSSTRGIHLVVVFSCLDVLSAIIGRLYSGLESSASGDALERLYDKLVMPNYEHIQDYICLTTTYYDL